ncbi:MAG: hypothetical protein HUU35_06585 [Armatimonadetes bacterium]|nr:hypothetical protein [Armatimonadota bacterium]
MLQAVSERVMAGAVLGALLVGTITWMVLLWWQWRRGRTLFDRRQMLLRAGGGLVMLILWLLLGALLLVVRPLEQPRQALLLFYSALAVTLVLPFLALLDLRLLRLNRAREERQLTEDFRRTFSRPLGRDEP